MSARSSHSCSECGRKFSRTGSRSARLPGASQTHASARPEHYQRTLQAKFWIHTRTKCRLFTPRRSLQAQHRKDHRCPRRHPSSRPVRRLSQRPKHRQHQWPWGFGPPEPFFATCNTWRRSRTSARKWPVTAPNCPVSRFKVPSKLLCKFATTESQHDKRLANLGMSFCDNFGAFHSKKCSTKRSSLYSTTARNGNRVNNGNQS